MYDCNGTTPTHRMPNCWPFNWKLRGVGILADGTFVGGSEGPNSTTTVTRFRRDPHTGNCSFEQPFWLEKAKTLDFDPRRDVAGYDDLKRFGHFEDEWLRGGPVRRVVLSRVEE